MGSGIDEKAKEAVSKLFQTSKPQKGAGLGLPTVAAIVNKYDGRMEIDTTPRCGNDFQNILPRRSGASIDWRVLPADYLLCAQLGAGQRRRVATSHIL